MTDNIEHNTTRLHAYVNTHTNYKVSVVGDAHIVTRKTWGGIDIEVGCMTDGVFRNPLTNTQEHLFQNIRHYLDQLDREHEELLAMWPRPSLMMTLKEVGLYLSTYTEMGVSLLEHALTVNVSPNLTLYYSLVDKVLVIYRDEEASKGLQGSDLAFLEMCQMIEDHSGGAAMFISIHDKDFYNNRVVGVMGYHKAKAEHVAKMRQELDLLERQLEKATEELDAVRQQLVKSAETCPAPEKAAWALSV